MSLPPQFLDEIRARVGLAEVIGRRVRLQRRGREHVGLCPFHNEKTPSFNVVEDKGFYHCFGCGAHGDVIGFVMRTEGLAFMEAIEKLAAEAGLQVPEATPEQRREERRRATLYDAMDRAARWFRDQLNGPAGRQARDYLAGRGFDEVTLERFGLGFAPDRSDALKRALVSAELPEALLIEAGLLIKPDDGRASYDRFRGRIAFPITDRRGRVIAFGARTLGDGQPKYLNSPDTPLFQKGQVLYGLATARKPAQDTGRVVVVEGYTDVIALAQAGIAEAVAPLGTALTERQILELWRLAPEPVLCFDGDAAGGRAAARAAERALPLLRPGVSLQFVTLPSGHDPASLIADGGRDAMEDLLDGARPLDRVIWEIETTGRKLDTPERRAGLEKRLDERILQIADRTVQLQYRALMRDRIWRLGRAPRRTRPAAGDGPLGAAGPTLGRRRVQTLLATAVNHPEVLHAHAESLGALAIPDPALARLREAILTHYAASESLDSTALRCQLMAGGMTDALDGVLATDVYAHAGFARPGASLAAAEAGFTHTLTGHSEPQRRAEIEEAERSYVSNPTDENWTRYMRLRDQLLNDPLAHSNVTNEIDAFRADGDLDPPSPLTNR